MTDEVVRSVLLIENDLDYAQVIESIFRNQVQYPFHVVHASTMEDARTQLASCTIDVVLLDLALPGVDPQFPFLQVRLLAPRVAIVLLTTRENESVGIIAMQEGAQDYLVRGQIEPRELTRALRNAIERKILKEALFEEKERAQVTLNSIADAVICTDAAGNISFLNPVAESMTGCSLLEAIGRPLTDTFHIIDANTGDPAPNPMKAIAGRDRPARLPVNCILIREDGKEIFIEDSVAPIHDRAGKAAGSVLVFRDVTQARALAAQVIHLAEHDFLTGLPNRLLLNDRLGQAIAHAQRNHGIIALLFLDLDGFKHINDSLGHPAGDKLLQSVAKRLTACIRNPDTVSRQGGDEFLVVLQDIARPEDAAVTAQRILDCVAQIHFVDNHNLLVTASIGISIYPDDGFNAETLIKNADTAMYQAKAQGRQRFRFFKLEMNVRAVERQFIEEGLRHAQERNELILHYQPIVDLSSGMICGEEALLRWNHPTLGIVSPSTFIPIAEDTGLILSIGNWVLREACLQSKRWTDAGLAPATISVNVSAIQFQNEDFLANVFTILADTGFDPRCLELEMTESVLMKHADDANSILQSLRSHGIRIALDDFGTGFSSLNYLRRFPLDSLKIDQSFVRQISGSDKDSTLVTAIISMAQSLKLTIIAEGVETQPEQAFLRMRGCEHAQGYLFSKPVPADEFATLLANGPPKFV